MGKFRVFAFGAIVSMLAALALPASATVSSLAPVHIVTPKAPAPSWYTPALHRAVMAAGSRGVPLPSSARIPTSSLAFQGIRPGQLLIINGGTLCTSNFVFRNGTSWAIGTAGHCGNVGDTVSMLYLPKGLVHIGNIIKSTGDPGDDTSVTDFALISILPALVADISPSMAYWGGPTGAFTGSGVQAILHAGWGLVAGTGGTPRAGLAYQWANEYRFEGVVTPGDSGSGAIVAGGLAAGNITHIAVDTSQTVPAWNGGTSIGGILAFITGWSLATCQSAVPWPLPGCPPL